MKPYPPHPLRTRFGEIVCEFLPPPRSSTKALILAAGLPGYPGGSGKAIRALAEKGYWVFVPRYRGTWESGGRFLEEAPHEDILAVAEGITRPFVDYYSGRTHRLPQMRIYVIGASFGGAAAILASRDARIAKAVALTPVVDWKRQEATAEPLEAMRVFIPAAFGEAYRFNASAWKKLASGTFYSPAHEMQSIIGAKLFIIHTKDDSVVPFAPAQAFANNVGARFAGLARGGHFGVSSVLKPHVWKRVEAFFKEKSH